jgi:SAM-dependent methyltransferase
MNYEGEKLKSLIQLLILLFGQVSWGIDSFYDPALCLRIYERFRFVVSASEIALIDKAKSVSDSELRKRVDPAEYNPNYIEIGPGSAPYCNNALFVEPKGAEKAIAVAKQRGGNPRSLSASAEKLPLPDQSVDSILMKHFPFFLNSMVIRDELNLNAIREGNAILNEMFRVLKPGAKAYIVNSLKTEYIFRNEKTPMIFKSAPQAVAYTFSDVIRAATESGFKVTIIQTETLMGIEIAKP